MENKTTNIHANELNDEQLDQVAGGVIKVFDAPATRDFWKYTCRACGDIGIVSGRPSVCCNCKGTNIVCEEYKP